MRRYHIEAAKPHKVLNTLEPKLGLCIQAYFSRKDIGSGVRAFFVIGVSPRYVTLFYPPTLYAFKIKLKKEWPYLAAKEYSCNYTFIITSVEEKRRMYREYNRRVNNTMIEKALAVLAKQVKVQHGK